MAPSTRKQVSQPPSNESKAMKTIELGNSEAISKGVTQNNDGTYTAMTFTQSKDFKTLKGAEKWLARKSR